jgi:hypothetical protein
LNFKEIFRLQLALALHPDKNGAPGADEAFKCKSCCYNFNAGVSISSILSTCLAVSNCCPVWIIIPLFVDFHSPFTDPQKRAVFDSGTDPDDRFGGMSSRASGFPSSFGNGRFEGELSPEDLFNMFFGGSSVNAFGSSDFGGGPSMSTFRNLYSLKSLIFFGQLFSLLVQEASVLKHLDRVRGRRPMPMPMLNRVLFLCNSFL